jgi:hypothetical protein
MLLLISAALAQDDCASPDVATLAEQAVQHVAMDELDLASQRVAEAVDGLECLDRVPEPEHLVTLWQVRGAVGLFSGKAGMARDNLRIAKGMHPGWFNEDLGAEARTAWEAADPLGSATVTAWPIPDEGVLYIDGQLRTEQPVQLSAGPHLIQVAIGAEVHFADFAELADQQVLELATGLPEPSRRRRLGPWLLAAGGSAAAAGGAWTGAWLLDAELEPLKDKGQLVEMEQARMGSLALAASSVALGVVSAGSIAMHVRWRKARLEPASETSAGEPVEEPVDEPS